MKIFSLIILLGLTINGFGQKTKQQIFTNEIKLNLFNEVFFNSIDISYEHAYNENYSIGISFFVKHKNYHIGQGEMLILPIGDVLSRNFSITPFYRRYFSKKYAKGLFLEAYGMYAKRTLYTDIDNVGYNIEKITNAFLGFAVGYKIKTYRGFVIETYFGVRLFNYYFTRGGIAIGYSF